MKIIVIGMDGAVPSLLFGDERLSNFRRLMEKGCCGRLETTPPSTAVPAWMCMATSLDPGSLGIYGLRDRKDYSYDSPGLVDSRSIHDLAIWDQVAREGKRATVIGAPPSYPPRKVSGLSVGCFLTPDTVKDDFTYPASAKAEITKLTGGYPVDVRGSLSGGRERLKDDVYDMSRKHFEVARHYLRNSDWDYFQFVEVGLDRLQHGFWKSHDPEHALHVHGDPDQEVIREYYLYLDQELGRVLDLIDEDTAVLALSNYGAQRLDGGFCVNEWLYQEGYLALNDYPKEATAFGKSNVNWGKTRVWGEGGAFARLYFNVKGREPNGVVELDDYERFRNEVKAKLEAAVDEQGSPLGTLVFKPEEAYRTVRNVAPDLIAQFAGLRRRSIGGLGYSTVHLPASRLRESGAGPDDCSPTPEGCFILAASNCSLRAEIAGARVLDLAPTLLDLGGFDIPGAMQGKSLAPGRGMAAAVGASRGYAAEQEATLCDRLGLFGYV